MARWFGDSLIEGEIGKVDVYDMVLSKLRSAYEGIDVTVQHTVIPVLPYEERVALKAALNTALSEVRKAKRQLTQTK